MNAKTTFLNSEHRKAFEEMTMTPAFQVACDYAVLQMVENQAQAGDPNTQWTEHAKLTGAQQVLGILKTLHLPEPEPKNTRMDGLRKLAQ